MINKRLIISLIFVGIFLIGNGCALENLPDLEIDGKGLSLRWSVIFDGNIGKEDLFVKNGDNWVEQGFSFSGNKFIYFDGLELIGDPYTLEDIRNNNYDYEQKYFSYWDDSNDDKGYWLIGNDKARIYARGMWVYENGKSEYYAFTKGYIEIPNKRIYIYKPEECVCSTPEECREMLSSSSDCVYVKLNENSEYYNSDTATYSYLGSTKITEVHTSNVRKINIGNNKIFDCQKDKIKSSYDLTQIDSINLVGTNSILMNCRINVKVDEIKDMFEVEHKSSILNVETIYTGDVRARTNPIQAQCGGFGNSLFYSVNMSPNIGYKSCRELWIANSKIINSEISSLVNNLGRNIFYKNIFDTQISGLDKSLTNPPSTPAPSSKFIRNEISESSSSWMSLIYSSTLIYADNLFPERPYAGGYAGFTPNIVSLGAGGECLSYTASSSGRTVIDTCTRTSSPFGNLYLYRNNIQGELRISHVSNVELIDNNICGSNGGGIFFYSGPENLLKAFEIKGNSCHEEVLWNPVGRKGISYSNKICAKDCPNPKP
jgi:hypothetical protein